MRYITDPLDLNTDRLLEPHYGRLHSSRWNRVAASDAEALQATCATCGRLFYHPAGLVAFSAGAGVPLPDRCSRCRPSRRAALSTTTVTPHEAHHD
jgi:hypothetical protein